MIDWKEERKPAGYCKRHDEYYDEQFQCIYCAMSVGVVNIKEFKGIEPKVSINEKEKNE